MNRYMFAHLYTSVLLLLSFPLSLFLSFQQYTNLCPCTAVLLGCYSSYKKAVGLERGGDWWGGGAVLQCGIIDHYLTLCNDVCWAYRLLSAWFSGMDQYRLKTFTLVMRWMVVQFSWNRILLPFAILQVLYDRRVTENEARNTHCMGLIW